MQISDLSQKFWVVTEPTPDSILGDCCFECDLKRFAAQIRGGLDENTIKGVFAEERDAVMLAESLMKIISNDISAPTYTYYVATLARYVLIPAANAREALEAGERHAELKERSILTVRIATKQEIEDMAWYEQKLAEERRRSGP